MILLGLGSQSNDVQSEKEFDLDRLSSIEGDVKVGFIFYQLIQIELLSSLWMVNLYKVWPLMAGVALVTACILFSCLVGFGLVLLLTYKFQALIRINFRL